MGKNEVSRTVLAQNIQYMAERPLWSCSTTGAAPVVVWLEQLLLLLSTAEEQRPLLCPMQKLPVVQLVGVCLLYWHCAWLV
jgi:hypothetical protein